MSIEDEIAKLTQSTNELLDNVMTKKATLDTAVSDATTQASLAATEKVGALGYRNEAEGFKDQAYTYSATAEIEADRAKSEADNASAVVSGGTATLNSTAGSIPLADSDGVIDASWLPAEITGRNVFAEEQAIGNAKYAASGFVHMGKQLGTTSAINQGMHVSSSLPNIVYMGRADTYAVGGSKTSFPVINIAGIETELQGINAVVSHSFNKVKFPDAPNGTVTYDSATGVITDYTKDVDPKYGDVAADTNEAVARAFEGRVKNGDMRLGTTGWQAVGVTLSAANGVLTVTSDGSASPRAQQKLGNLSGGAVLEAGTYTATCNLKSVSAIASRLSISGATTQSWDNVYDGFDEKRVCTFTVDGIATIYVQLYLSSLALAGGYAEYSNIQITKVTTEVVTERVDMFGFEGFLEEVTASQPFVYPNGLIQSQATTMDGVTTGTSNRPVTYYAVFDGDETSRGKGVNFLTASDANKRKMFSNPKNNLYWIEGKLYQWRVRQRTIAGAGNGDWESTNSIEDDNLQYATKRRLMAQGAMNAPFCNVSLATTNVYYRGSAYTTSYYGVVDMPIGAFRAITNNNTSSPDDPSVSAIGGGYFLVCGTVPRLNQGAYHPSFNPMGSRQFQRFDTSGAKTWESNLIGPTPTKKDCFHDATYILGELGLRPNSGAIGQNSGRPDGKFYDAIYASGQGGVIDYRLSAWDKSSPEEAAKVDAMVKNGSYRGVEYLTRTVIFDVTTSGGNANGNSVYFSKTDYEVFNQFFTANVTVGTGTTAGWTQAHKAKTIGYLQRVDTGDIAPLIGYGYGSYGGSVNHFALAAGYYKTDWQDKECRAILFISREFSTSNSYVTSKLSVSGEFTQTDVIGDPANILQNPDLKDGWLGSWIPQVPTTGDMELTRKALAGFGTWRYTFDDGDTYTSATFSFDSVTNDFPVGSPRVGVVPYTAFAKQTKVANNEPVFNGEAGVGSVESFNNYQVVAGNLLVESFIGKIMTDTSSRTNRKSSVLDFKFNAVGEITNSTATGPTHNPLILSSDTGIALKALNIQVESNQQLGINYSYEELTYDTDWGDNNMMSMEDGQTTNTDDNGNTVLCGTATLAIPYGWVKNEV